MDALHSKLKLNTSIIIIACKVEYTYAKYIYTLATTIFLNSNTVYQLSLVHESLEVRMLIQCSRFVQYYYVNHKNNNLDLLHCA